MSATLTATDLRHLGAASDALLSPLAAPHAWRRAVADAMRALFGVAHALFVTPDAGRARFDSDSADPATLRRLAELTASDARSGHLRAADPVVDGWFRRRATANVEVYNEALNDRMTGHRLHVSAIVNDALRPGGFHDFLGFMTRAPEGEMMLFLGHARRGRSRFGERELDVLAALLPAFRAGHRALLRFGARYRSLGATLDALGDAVLVVGADGREQHRNVALRRRLAEEPERETVERALLAAARAGRPAAVVATALARYTITVTRLPADLTGDAGGVLATLDRDAAPTPADPARFGLTARESQVAQALARRLTNAEVAAALGISPHTALRHTERVLTKLGVHSRHDVGRVLFEAR